MLHVAPPSLLFAYHVFHDFGPKRLSCQTKRKSPACGPATIAGLVLLPSLAIVCGELQVIPSRECVTIELVRTLGYAILRVDEYIRSRRIGSNGILRGVEVGIAVFAVARCAFVTGWTNGIDAPRASAVGRRHQLDVSIAGLTVPSLRRRPQTTPNRRARPYLRASNTRTVGSSLVSAACQVAPPSCEAAT